MQAMLSRQMANDNKRPDVYPVRLSFLCDETAVVLSVC